MALLSSPAWDHISSLTKDERSWLKWEEDSRSRAADDTLWTLVRGMFKNGPSSTHITSAKQIGFWGQPKDLRETIVTLCVAAVVQGWNQTSANGANLTWWKYLGLSDLNSESQDPCQPSSTDAWIFALVNSAMWFAGSTMCVNRSSRFDLS